jgi:parallel beta-helix repeat protein
MAVSAKLLHAGRSDVGRQRKNNEDRIWIDADRGIFVVIDGLGGHAAGETAAETAVEFVSARLLRQTGTVEDRLAEAITLANNEIGRLAAEKTDLRGMACVLTAAVVDNGDVVVGHVGDSRLYYLEHGTIRKVTHDHSPVGEREDSGELPEREAMTHPRRNEVYRDLGSEYHEPDDPDFIEIVRMRFPPHAALLLCSDGLTDQVTSSEILRTVEKHAGRPELAVEELIDAANRAGGKDNVSVILIEGPEFLPPRREVRSVEPQAVEPRRGGGIARTLLGVLLGILLAVGAVAALRPHFVETATGRVLRFGNVRHPLTWRVNANGNAQFTSIAAAIEKALPGDTIEVDPGTYRGNLKLRDGLQVLGQQAVVYAEGTVVTADGVKTGRFAGFAIRGDAPEIGLFLANSDLELSGLEITAMSRAGVVITGESSPTLRASRIFANAAPGIIVRDGARPVISHNTIAGNRVGIHVRDTSSPKITGNIVSDNGTEQVWVSPLFDASRLIPENYIAPGSRNVARQVRVVNR